MEKPKTTPLKSQIFKPNKSTSQLRLLCFLSLFIALFFASCYHNVRLYSHSNSGYRPIHVPTVVERCRQLVKEAGPPLDFRKRSQSDRFVLGTKPVLIKGARIWTGKKNGTEVLRGDALLDRGLIKKIGHVRSAMIQEYKSGLTVVDANGSWLTPGIIDIHSHIGDFSSPALGGAQDGNSLNGTIQPWLRSLDGLNTHDDSYLLSIAGGVTTVMVLPGSANAIGGQGFVIKLRETDERSPSSMVLEPPYQINSSFPNPNLPPRWRHIKHACGENPSNVYDATRMDTMWAFREAYNKARQIKERQDKFCSQAMTGNWRNLGNFPEELEWEALVDVLRGRVKVNVHCYEAVDIDDFIRLSNEFKIPIAAFHHASEAYLIPSILKKAHGKPPAVALFATMGRYKREAYRSSEFAPRILATHGLTVLMKSDHPVLNSRFLLYEAQQAHYYGLPENLALASVTSNSAEVMGMGHRIGYIAEGYDADLVLWDSHPMALGATPSQVFIDGIPQFISSHVVRKPQNFQHSPKVPNFDKEARKTVLYEGLPPLAPKKNPLETTIFTNVKQVFTKLESGKIEHLYSSPNESDLGVLIVCNGTLVCFGSSSDCINAKMDENTVTIDLEGGSISPGLVTYGSPLGLEHIKLESSTNDGTVYDPLLRPVPDLLGGDFAIVRAVDGLQFGSRDALLAYRSGVTSAIVAPSHDAFYAGLGTSFSLGASHKLQRGAIIQEVTAVHVTIGHFSKPSVSSQVAVLRRLLLSSEEGATGAWFKKVREGLIPLVVEAHSADIIATLIYLKKEVEATTRKNLKLTITGASEAHLLARELGESGVGVLLNPARPFPLTWERRRILPGPPITKEGAVLTLLSHNVLLGIGSDPFWTWSTRNLPFDIAWAAIEAGGKITKEEAFAIASTNIEKLLGVEPQGKDLDLVATRGGDLLDISSKVVAVISPARQMVLLM